MPVRKLPVWLSPKLRRRSAVRGGN
jgi:hypothetical protein